MQMIETMARICHEVNRSLQAFNGEIVSPPYDEAPDWQKDAIYQGVIGALRGMTPEQSHESWAEELRLSGWSYGDHKDEGLKTHPCLVSYSELPPEQRLKDHVRIAIVRGFTEASQHESMSYSEWLDSALKSPRPVNEEFLG